MADHRWSRSSRYQARPELPNASSHSGTSNPHPEGRPKFYDVDQYKWLVDAAEKIDPRIYLLVLLGGDAGLRRGEIIALERSDVDLRRGLLTIERSEWKGR